MTDPRVLLDAYAAEPDWAAVEGKYREHEAPKAFAALRAVLDKHKLGYCGGVAQYGIHWESVTIRGANGEIIGDREFSVQNDEPDPPNWCHACDDLWPCPTVQAITTALEAK